MMNQSRIGEILVESEHPIVTFSDNESFGLSPMNARFSASNANHEGNGESEDNAVQRFALGSEEVNEFERSWMLKE